MPDIAMLLNIAETMETDLNKILYTENKNSVKDKISIAFTGIIIAIMAVLRRGYWWKTTAGLLAEYSIWNAGRIYNSLKQVIYNPVLWFTIPVLIIQIYKLAGAFRLKKPFKYGTLIRVAIILFMLLTFYNYLPQFFMIDLKEAVYTAKPLLWLNYPDFSFIPPLPGLLSRALYYISGKMKWLYSILGIIFELSRTKAK